MVKKSSSKSIQLQGVLGVLRGANQVVIFQRNGVVRGYDASLPVKRPNQYKQRS